LESNIPAGLICKSPTCALEVRFAPLAGCLQNFPQVSTLAADKLAKYGGIAVTTNKAKAN
jgi:hypothetical protein